MEEHVPPSRSKFLRGLIACVLILFLGAMLLRVMSRMRKRPKKKGGSKAISLKVETRRVNYSSSMLRLRGYGTAQADQKLELVPEVSGRVVYAIKPFKQGIRVKRGKLLFRIDPSNYSIEYKRLKAQISSTRKQIKIAARAYQVARRNLSRSRRLVKRRALDQSSYERAQQAVLDRGQRLESLRQGLEVNLLMLRRAGLNLNRTAVRAPFAARITQGEIIRGTFVSAGRKVATIESVEAIEIPISFALSSLRKIRDSQGKPVPLQSIPDALAKLPPVEVRANATNWRGRVSRVGANVDLSTRTLTLFVRIDLKKQNQIGNLLPGTFCRVSIPARKLSQGFELPKQAVYGDKVYIVQKGKLVARTIQIAYEDSESVLVGGGLKQGDQVIVSQLNDPIEGTPVFTQSDGKSSK